jgi:bacterioferritin
MDKPFLSDIKELRRGARSHIAIDSYGEMVRYIGDDDPTTRRMLEGILATEEEHADDLRNVIETQGKGEREASHS